MDLREIDALVAEKVMGWIYIDKESGHPTENGPFKDCDCPSHSYQKTKIPFYSSDIAAAWEAVEKMDDYDITKNIFGNPAAILWINGNIGAAEADTAPLAICLAALKAKGIEIR